MYHAVSAVMLAWESHCMVRSTMTSSLQLAPGGFVGVDVFFVVSGYVIAGVVMRRQAAGQFSLIDFWERRTRRLLPAVLAMIAGTTALACFHMFPDELVKYAGSSLATLGFAANIWFWQTIDYFSAPADMHPLLHAWSLGVEEQFYIVFPLVMMGLWRRAPRAVKPVLGVIAVASFALGVFWMTNHPSASFYLPMTRAWELLLGVLLAMGAIPAPKDRRIRSLSGLAGLGLILWAIATYQPHTNMPGIAAIVPCLGALLLLSAGEDTPTGALLSIPPLRFYGFISYSLYLWHWPLISFQRMLYGPEAGPVAPYVVFAIAVVLATISWKLIETPIRAITAAHVNSLLRVPGIVTSASRTRPKASVVKLRCKKCNSERNIACPNGLSSRMLPRVCEGQKANVSDNAGNAPPGVGAGPDARCPMDPFVVVADECKYVDQQTLRLQEPPEDVPTGEMPRHVKLVVERALADKIAPGTRVAVLAVAAVAAESGGPRGRGGGEDAGGGGVGVRVPYLRVVGVVLREMGSGRASMTFTPDEEERLVSLSKQPNIYETMAASVAPSLRGDYTEDIKRAILCLLMSGSRRLLQDGARLRGDINVLLLGDPSTAKSQFLKFVERVAPVGVYTSGKGSSAAGLTASVIRSLNGEFHLEGGAMVLADGGVVCIDEFDKMREEDRVAIHEAMEQQTISVAKAGITTILNSRCSVLAAANPVFGRYDDTRSAADNIDLLPTILSRFDLIFIVRDLRDEKRDIATARHVVRLHVASPTEGDHQRRRA
jgi:peptidoglycan/LPS O-acetylase OafA/YrhL